MAEEDIVVNVEETPETPQPESQKPDEAKSAPAPIDEFKKQFEDLKTKAERAQQDYTQAVAREQSERNARMAAEQEAASTRNEITQSRLDAIESEIGTAQAEASAAKSEYIAAQEAGDWKRAAEANERQADARARLALANANKAYEASRQQQQPAPRPQQPPGDPVEAFLATKTEASANWLRAHREWMTDRRKSDKLVAAHHDALGDGLTIDSPEYFTHVEKFLGLKKDDPVEAPEPKKRTPTPPVVPVGTSGSSTNSGYEVRLSKGEAERATDGTLVWNYSDPSGKNRWKKGDPIGTQEFARRKRAMQERGDYDKTFTEQ